MVSFPNAKINIGLNILNKRADGFHNIETIFYPVGLTDIMEIIEQPPEIQTNQIFSGTGIHIAADDQNNLCVKSYYLLRSDFKIPPVFIHLHKIIPVGSGLGGGSADAAFMIRMINQYFKLNLSREQMIRYAAQLGSDCSFFMINQPVFASGKGEQMQQISLNLKGLYLVMINPDIQISTAEAYRDCKPSVPEKSLKELIALPIHQWKANIQNDFEKQIFFRYPQLEQIKNKLYDSGAVYASMSGSGSTIYGIFEAQVSMKKMFPDCFVWEGYF
jgi:4-diphosphocytidyl-2-C-methyl-D-erythritol kinase